MKAKPWQVGLVSLSKKSEMNPLSFPPLRTRLKGAVYETEFHLSAVALALNFLESRKVRNKLLLSEVTSPVIFCYSSMNRLIRSVFFFGDLTLTLVLNPWGGLFRQECTQSPVNEHQWVQTFKTQVPSNSLAQYKPSSPLVPYSGLLLCGFIDGCPLWQDWSSVSSNLGREGTHHFPRDEFALAGLVWRGHVHLRITVYKDVTSSLEKSDCHLCPWSQEDNSNRS